MGLFSSKKHIYVGGAISRLLEDEKIENPYKYVILEALFNDRDIGEGIREFGIIGTAANYNGLFNLGKSKIGLPNFLVSYRRPDLVGLSSYMSGQVGCALTEGSIQSNVKIGYPTKNDYIQYLLQEDLSYDLNYGTKALKVPEITGKWLFKSATYDPGCNNIEDPTDCNPVFTVTVERTVEVKTTTYTRYYFRHFSGDIWHYVTEVKKKIETKYINPVDDSTEEIIDWDETGYVTLSAAEILTQFGLTLTPDMSPYYKCSGTDFICSTTVSIETKTETKEFTYEAPMPDKYYLYGGIPGNLNSGEQELAHVYWIITYTCSKSGGENREYIWIENIKTSSTNYLTLETDVNLAGQENVTIFNLAPVIPIRDDGNWITKTSDPTNYNKYKLLMRKIGIKYDELSTKIEDSLTTNGQSLDDILDVYFTLGSQLIPKRTDEVKSGESEYNLDELAYNFHFFDKLNYLNSYLATNYGAVSNLTYENGDEVGDISTENVFPNNYITIKYGNTYNHRIYWEDILTTVFYDIEKHEYQLEWDYNKDSLYYESDPTDELTATNINHYYRMEYSIIKREEKAYKIGNVQYYKYRKIKVKNLGVNYVVMEGDEATIYQPEIDTGDNKSLTQFCLPISKDIIKLAIKGHKDEFYQRISLFGFFSKKVVRVSWWRGILQFIFMAIAVYLFIQYLIEYITIQTNLMLANLIEVTSISIAKMVVGYVFKSVALNMILKRVLLELMASTNNKTLQSIYAAIFIITSFELSGGFNNTLFKQALTLGQAYTDTINTQNLVLSKELKQLMEHYKEIAEIEEELTKGERIREARREAMDIYNLFQLDPSKVIIEDTGLDFIENTPEYFLNIMSLTMGSLTKIVDPATLIAASEELVSLE